MEKMQTNSGNKLTADILIAFKNITLITDYFLKSNSLKPVDLRLTLFYEGIKCVH